MGLKKEYARRTKDRCSRFMTMRLRNNPGLLCHSAGQRMIKIVGVVQRVRQNEPWAQFSIDVGELIEHTVINPQGIVADIKELRLRAENLSRSQSLLLASCLDSLDRHTPFRPE